MGYKLVEVQADEEFTPLIASYRDGFGNPGNALWPLFTGDYRRVEDEESTVQKDGDKLADSERPEDLAATRQLILEEATARFLAQHRGDPRSTWLQVVDEDSGAVAAGGKWVVFEHGKPNPYDAYEPPTATWYPEGAARDAATDFLRQFLATRVKLANRPHVFLNILWTHPAHRGRGCARLIMNWGLRRADELGLEAFLEATREGKPVYEAFGFEAIEQNCLKTGRASLVSADDAAIIARMLRALTPFTWWSMRRLATAYRSSG